MSDGIMSNLEDAQECVERVLASQDGYRSIEFSACVESSDACAASDHDSVSESFGTARAWPWWRPSSATPTPSSA